MIKKLAKEIAEEPPFRKEMLKFLSHSALRRCANQWSGSGLSHQLALAVPPHGPASSSWTERLPSYRAS